VAVALEFGKYDMTDKEDCIILTYFADYQPGFLDFVYRVRALSQRYNVMLVSRSPLHQPEWEGIDGDRIVFPRSESRKDWIRYLFDCAALVKRYPGRRVILLASVLAPMALLVRGRAFALYWNEHPTHFSADPPDGGVLKTLFRRFTRWSLYYSARRTTLVMPIGEAHRDDLLSNGVSPKRMRMIYMGVHAGFVSSGDSRHLDSGPVRLIYVGSVSRERGRDVMLEGLAEASRHGVPAHLTLVGANDEQISYCRDYAKRLGIDSKVSVIGRVSGTEIPRYLRAADVGVCLWEDQPWWRFNPPTKLFEYLVAGLPVLASDIRTHTAYIQDGHNGFIFAYSAAGFASAIQRLHEGRAELGTLSAQAKDTGEEFLWGKIEPTFLSVVHHLEPAA
jgi:glycosyltransferase involved in cell wall biosynthesis